MSRAAVIAPAAAGDSRFAVFRAWVATKQAQAATSTKRSDRFSDHTAHIYESLWRGWVEWLGAKQIEWHAATADHVRAFLGGPAPAPSDRPTRKPIDKDKMAPYTSQRYWRVLQAVYGYAVVNDLVSASPCVDAAQHKPHLGESETRRRLLASGVLQLLRDPERLAQLLPLKDEHHWWVLRDRAAVALLAHCALAPGELIALRGLDLSDGREMLPAHDPAPQLPGVPAPALVPRVDVPERGDRPAHSVPIPPAALASLKPWLARREVLLQDQRRAFDARRASLPVTPGRSSQPPEPPTLAEAPVLLSREAPGGQALPPLEPATLYFSVKRCINAALRAAGHDPDNQYFAQGPAVVRNAVIADWALTLGAEETAARTGIKPESLRALTR